MVQNPCQVQGHGCCRIDARDTNQLRLSGHWRSPSEMALRRADFEFARAKISRPKRMSGKRTATVACLTAGERRLRDVRIGAIWVCHNDADDIGCVNGSTKVDVFVRPPCAVRRSGVSTFPPKLIWHASFGSTSRSYFNFDKKIWCCEGRNDQSGHRGRMPTVPTGLTQCG